MEEEGIDLVLWRATELRFKISNCIHKATTTSPAVREDSSTGKQNGVASDGVGDVDEDEVLERERLLNICDAFESLETQLFSLQDLKQQQNYEREVALGEIELSRKMLLDKLKDYKGEHLEVINEAFAFAAEAVKQNHDLILPPYPSRPPYSLHLNNNGHLLQPSTARNGVISSYLADEAKKEMEEPLPTNNPSSNRLLSFITAAAKSVITIVGVVSILNTSGRFGHKFANRGTGLKISSEFQHPSTEEERIRIECPAGKILVVENGEARCLVKERVEVPFSSVVITKPDVNYGCG